MRLLQRLIVLILVPQLATAPVWAVKHIGPNPYTIGDPDQVRIMSPEQIHKFGSLRAATISSTTGAKTVAVIIVQFPSANSSLTTGSASIQSLSKIDTYFTQMNTYFVEASFGKIPSITFKFFGSNTSSSTGDSTAATAGAYTLANPMEYYGCGDEGVGCTGITTPTPGQVRANGDYLIKDALTKARAATSGPTSKASGGTFDAVIVIHAGNGNETTSANGDVWSIFYSQDNIVNQGGGGFTEGDIVPETEGSGITSPLGVMCHEFGHELGLPDQYNTSSVGGTSVVGNWELMDSGPFDGSGANPSHPGAWDKYNLGWASPVTVSSKNTYTLGYVESSGNSASMLKLAVGNGLPQEYFLVEYRSPSATGASYDRNIPGEGLLIWHIDDAITSSRGVAVTDQTLANTVNSGSPHYGISIVTADGVSISNSNEGDSGNVFSNGKSFTSPQSNDFAGDPTGINLVNIAGVGTTQVTVDVTNFAVGSSQTLIKTANYPNPAGTGYLVTTGVDGQTIIQFQMTQPAKAYTLDLYTLAGGLVRKVAQTDIKLNVNRSGDNKWVYEYTWDLTNGDGEKVAPGVYFYLIRVDGNNKTGKIVVIR